MAKKHNKLKSSLDRYKHEQNIKQQQKVLDKKKEKVKIPTKVDKLPFKEDDSILLIGEGNFSFTLSLLRDHNLSPFQLTSTSVEKEQEAYDKYADCKDIVHELLSNQVTVLFEVDGTDLQSNKDLKGRRFTKIYFGFPHVGLGIKEEDRNIRANQALILRFLASSYDFLTNGEIDHNYKKKRKIVSSDHEDGDNEEEDDDIQPSTETNNNKQGTVMITLKQGSPYNKWEITSLAKKPPIQLPEVPRKVEKHKSKSMSNHNNRNNSKLQTRKYNLLKSYKFNYDFYKIYQHKLTKNDSSIMNSLTDARTFEFVPNKEGK